MRIVELISEQTIGPVGSTTADPGQVPQVSQQKTEPPKEQPNPKIQQLAALLKQNNVIGNEKEINDFIGAYNASSTNKTLNPAQQDIINKLSGPLMKDPTLAGKLKMLATTKPGQNNTQQSPTGV